LNSHRTERLAAGETGGLQRLRPNEQRLPAFVPLRQHLDAIFARASPKSCSQKCAIRVRVRTAQGRRRQRAGIRSGRCTQAYRGRTDECAALFDAVRRRSEDEANLLLDCIPALVENADLRGGIAGPMFAV